MTPVYVAGCFGMLHPAAGHHGVLICGTLGDEAMNVYRPLVFLAEQFAAAGCPTLRLDYYGAGDSAGVDDEPGRFQAWLDGITEGVRWLRRNCGVGPVTLVGVRIGAAIAARAAGAIDDVEALICLAPVPTGRLFLREMILAANTTAEIWHSDSRIQDGGWFEAHGMRIDRATRDALESLDVAKLPRTPALRALVLDAADSPAGRGTAERLRRRGTEVTHETIDGLETMLRDPYENAVPHAAFERAVAWHAAMAPDAIQGRAWPAAAWPPAAWPEDAALWIGCGEETPIRFGPEKALFGILCVPTNPCPGAPAMLIANTGANPRYGNSRGLVTIARWLAANGIASLRMDGAGIGDSAAKTGERGTPYSTLSDQDLGAGVDELVRRSGGPIFVLGMCSGAFHALRAAYDDPRIHALVLVNLQKFVWHEGESLSVVQRTTFRTTRFYLRNVVCRTVWRRLLHGEINVSGIARALAGRVIRRAAAAADPVLSLLPRKASPVSRVRRCLQALRQRNVPILFVLSGNDPGIDEVAEYFGSQGRQLKRQPNVMFRLLNGADHTISAHWARDALLGLIATFLQQRCGIPIGHRVDMRSAPAPVPLVMRDTGLRAPRRPAPTPVAIDTTSSAA